MQAFAHFVAHLLQRGVVAQCWQIGQARPFRLRRFAQMTGHDIRGIVALALETHGGRGELTLPGQALAAVGWEALAGETLPASCTPGEMIQIVGVLHFLSLGPAEALKNASARRRILITSFCAFFAVTPNSSANSGMLYPS